MKQMLFLAICGLLAGNAPAQKTIIHDPNVELREDSGFHAIEVSGGIDLYLSPGDRETVGVSAKDVDWRDHVRTKVENGILKIWLDKKKGWSWRGGSEKLRAYVSFTSLNGLHASGASDVYVDGVIAGSTLQIGLSGASDFKGAVRVDALNLNQSGASDMEIKGNVAGLTTIETSGASDFKGYDLSTERCVAHASGASDIRITVNKELSAHASGASSIDYKGDAAVRDVHSSGASSISRKS